MKYESLLKSFKKVEPNECYDYIIENAKKYYGDNVSTDIADYLCDRKENCVDFIECDNNEEIIEVIESHIEFTKTGKEPMIVCWYHVYKYKDYDNFNYANYYDKSIYI